MILSWNNLLLLTTHLFSQSRQLSNNSVNSVLHSWDRENIVTAAVSSLDALSLSNSRIHLRAVQATITGSAIHWCVVDFCQASMWSSWQTHSHYWLQLACVNRTPLTSILDAIILSLVQHTIDSSWFQSQTWLREDPALTVSRFTGSSFLILESRWYSWRQMPSLLNTVHKVQPHVELTIVIASNFSIKWLYNHMT